MTLETDLCVFSLRNVNNDSSDIIHYTTYNKKSLVDVVYFFCPLVYVFYMHCTCIKKALE